MHPSAAAHRGLRVAEAAREAVGHAWTRARDRGLGSPKTVWASFRGRRLAAVPVASFDGRRAVEETLTEVVGALTAAGVGHEVTLTEPPTVAVSTASWDDVSRALGALGAYAQQGAALAPVSRLRAGAGPVRVFRAWAAPQGAYLAGPDVGVDVVPGPAPAPAAELGDIDAVFTWVDGSDPAWQERKRRRLAALGEGPLHTTAANDARYAQIDELRYALRAAARYAPWLRRTYLVTDGQEPPWLAREFPRVVLVRHDEIFSEPAALPTFNSHAIESRLHHIPGLAERYLYLNDDFFLGRYAHPGTFFTPEGHPRLFLTDEAIPDGPHTPDDHPVVAAAKTNTTILERLTGTRAGHKLKHAPYAMLRSVALELEAKVREEFAATQRSPFRSPSDVSAASSLLPYYALATGRAALGEIAHFYADVASEELSWRLPRLLEHRDADVICLNATTGVPRRGADRARGFLEAYYPPL